MIFGFPALIASPAGLSFQRGRRSARTQRLPPTAQSLRENPGLDPIIHIVTLSSRGSVTDLVGNGTSWVTTDLGPPP